MFQNSDDGEIFVDDFFGDVERRRRVEGDAVGVVAAEEHHLVPGSEKYKVVRELFVDSAHSLRQLLEAF